MCLPCEVDVGADEWNVCMNVIAEVGICLFIIWEMAQFLYP